LQVVCVENQTAILDSIKEQQSKESDRWAKMLAYQAKFKHKQSREQLKAAFQAQVSLLKK